MKTVSIVIPVYNVEQYLVRCLDSIIHQTLEDIEILAVDDGSTDNSGMILDEYQSKYPEKLKVFHKKNGGLSDARNYGIRFATGEYVGFVDSDDYVEPEMFEKMYLKAKERMYDIVVCDFWEVKQGKKQAYTSRIERDGEGQTFVKNSMRSIYSSAWNKIYKRELLCKNLFTKGIWYEDVEFLYRLLPDVKSIGAVHECFYNYVIRKGSISNSAHKKIYDQIKNWNGLMEYYRNRGIYDAYKDELEYCYIRFLLALFVKSASQFGIKEFKRAKKEAIENVKKAVPDFRKNKYVQGRGVKNFYLRAYNSFFAYAVFVTENLARKFAF